MTRAISRLRYGGLVLLSVAFLFAAETKAQDPSLDAGSSKALSQQYQIIEGKIASTREKVSSWRREWWTLASLTFLVAALGGAVAVLQPLRFHGVKAATICAGLAVTVITAATAAFFPSDCRAIHKRISVAEATLEKIEFRLPLYHDLQNVKEKRELLEELLEQFKPIHDVEEASVARFAPFDLLPGLHASAQDLPPWARYPPTDNANRYFVGVAEARSLKEAKEESREQCLAKAEAELARGLTVYSGEALRAFLDKQGAVADVSFTYDRATGSYHYYTLFKVNKAFTEQAFVTSVATSAPWRAPCGLATLASGEIVVLDRTLGLFVMPVSSGKIRRLVDGFGLSQVADVASARIDGRDFVFVTMFLEAVDETRLLQFGLNGEPVNQWTMSLRRARFAGVAVDSATGVGYVSSSLEPEIYRVDLRRPRALASRFAVLPGAGRLGPVTLDTRRHRLLVADSAEGTLYGVSLDQGRASVVAKKGGEVAALALDLGAEQIWAADARDGRVLLLPLAAAVATPWQPLTVGELKAPRGLAIDAGGRLWIADTKTGTVAWLSKEGALANGIRP